MVQLLELDSSVANALIMVREMAQLRIIILLNLILPKDLCQTCHAVGMHVKEAHFRHHELLRMDSLNDHVWKHVSCNSCNRKAITGLRWKCTVCCDTDLCQRCFAEKRHDWFNPNGIGNNGRQHQFLRMIMK